VRRNNCAFARLVVVASSMLVASGEAPLAAAPGSNPSATRPPVSAKHMLKFDPAMQLGRAIKVDENGQHAGMVNLAGELVLPVGLKLIIIPGAGLIAHPERLSLFKSADVYGLDFSSNSVGGPVPADALLAAARHLRSITFLDLDGTNCTDKGLASVSGFDKIKFLNVSHTLISGAAIAKLSCLKNLLSLRASRVSEPGPMFAALPACLKLKFLVFHCRLLTAADTARIARVAQLEYLEIGAARIDAHAFNALTALKKLRNLQIEYSRQINVDGPESPVGKIGADDEISTATKVALKNRTLARMRRAMPQCKVSITN
jgi:hypothetical protein